MLKNIEGQTVPNVTFPIRQNDDWLQLSTSDIFKDKTVVVFSLPGAFTPTCSSTHLPRFNELAPVFKENGVDDIVCISVNDTFVMNAWAKDQDLKNVNVIPAGNGEFTEGVGMLVQKHNLGFGARSWRYAAIIDDSKIIDWFEEPGYIDNAEDDPYGETKPENVLTSLQLSM